MPVTVVGEVRAPVAVKVKLKLRAEAAPAWGQVTSRAAPKAAWPMSFLRWCGRECISANWLDLGTSEDSGSLIEV